MTYGDGSTGSHPTVLVESMVDAGRGCAVGPERALFAALLFDGVQQYMNYVLATAPAAKSRYREAFNWVNSHDDEYVFSFNSCCDALGIDPTALRFGILNSCTSQQLLVQRSRRKAAA